MKLIRYGDKWLMQNGSSVSSSFFKAGRFTEEVAREIVKKGSCLLMDEQGGSVLTFLTSGEMEGWRLLSERDSKIAYLEAMIQQMKDGCDGGCALDECVCEKDQRVVGLKGELDALQKAGDTLADYIDSMCSVCGFGCREGCVRDVLTGYRLVRRGCA